MCLPSDNLSGNVIVAHSLFEAGALDCGHGLIPEVRTKLSALRSGEVLEVRSSDPTVANDLGAWCRLTSNELLSIVPTKQGVCLFICKGKYDSCKKLDNIDVLTLAPTPTNALTVMPKPLEVPDLISLASAMIGSWPRPKWLLDALCRQTNNLDPDITFRAISNDATHMVVDAQLRAHVDIISLGYQSVLKSLDLFFDSIHNCALIYPGSKDAYRSDNKLQTDVARNVYSESTDQAKPVLYGKIGRKKNILVDELLFVQGLKIGRAHV